MENSCPYCNKDLTFKILPRKSVGQKIGRAKISTPCCKYCKQPLQINFPPTTLTDAAKDFSVCLVAMLGFLASVNFGSPAILIISLSIAVILYVLFLKQKINKFAIVKKYSKINLNDL